MKMPLVMTPPHSQSVRRELICWSDGTPLISSVALLTGDVGREPEADAEVGVVLRMKRDLRSDADLLRLV